MPYSSHELTIDEPLQSSSFPAEIISHGVWPYVRFCLGYLDVEELWFASGLTVMYGATPNWCVEFDQQYAKQLRAVYSPIVQGFRPRRHPVSAPAYRQELGRRFDTWGEIMSLPTAAAYELRPKWSNTATTTPVHLDGEVGLPALRVRDHGRLIEIQMPRRTTCNVMSFGLKRDSKVSMTPQGRLFPLPIRWTP